MAALALEGLTLGQIHCKTNRIINEAGPSEAQEITEINYEDSDLDNLVKIEIACKHRNVDYILKVFESKDMLYVTRAIKRSTWLVTEQQYSHIINPTSLYENLRPKMTVTGFKKFILHIRLNLKDENRVEEFFNYYKEKDFTVALKWLPLCSNKFTEEIIYKYAQKIPAGALQRLCEGSITCFKNYLAGQKGYFDRYTVLNSTKFLLKRNMEAYLDLIETDMNRVPRLGAKLTKLIMTKCPVRVYTNLENYCKILDLPTFVKFIKPEEMKSFMLTNIQKEYMYPWFTQYNIDYFIKRLPKEIRFEFIKELFIERKYKEIKEEAILNCLGYTRYNTPSSQSSVYMWYKYAPFKTAFTDLRKLIRSESKPQERVAMFEVLLKCAADNMDSLCTLLKYYRDNHINEPLKFKMQFVNEILRHADTHRFEEDTWANLNDLFSSMEVYNDNNNMDQLCVRSIVLYCVIHDKSVPDIIQQKFQFCTVKSFNAKLNDEEKEKMFLYLYNILTTKIENLDLNKKDDFDEAFRLWKDVLQLLLDSDKDLAEFPVILNEVKKIIHLNKENKWIEGLESLLDFKKSWRKLFFDESIILKPTQEAFINALRHDPELLEKYKDIVEIMCLNDDNAKIHFLKKLRIYWPQSLGHTYKTLFKNKLDQQKLHKSVTLGLCCMLPKKEISDLVEQYAPVETKVDWTRPDDVDFSIRKYLAMNLSLARPQPSATLALLYAKGDYLQYVLPSLLSILHNTRSDEIREYIPRLLNAPVSLQKHGIRIAFAKLRHDEIKQLFSDIWKSAKNSSIRADIFCQTFNFICGEKDEKVIKEMWQLLSIFIDNLKADENKVIYTKLSKVEKVPMVIRPEFWIKSYKFIKSLPPQANCEGLVEHLLSNMLDIMHLLDNNFLADLFLESIDEKLLKDRYEHANLLAACLLSTTTEKMHIDRCEKVLKPLLDRALPLWNETSNGSHFVQYNLQEIFSKMDQQFESLVLNSKMFMPVPLYSDIFERLSSKLPLVENYYLLTKRKLITSCVRIFDRVCETNGGLKAARASPEQGDCALWGPLYDEAAPQFARICAQYLKEDVASRFPSIYVLFGEAFDDIFRDFGFNSFNKLNVLRSVIESNDAIPFYLFVLNALPLYLHEDREIQMKSEILDKISSHSSEEVQIHYWLLKKKLNVAHL